MRDTHDDATRAGDLEAHVASAVMLVREDGHVLMVRHAAGPFARRWAMPFGGVAANETAEDAVARLLRDTLRIEVGPLEFLDTIALAGSSGERFAVNVFTCARWSGTPGLVARGPFDDAAWTPPAEAGALELLPEVRAWIAAQLAAQEVVATESGASGASLAPRAYDVAGVLALLADARGGLVAAFDALPRGTRAARLDGGWSPLDVLCHAADFEAYTVAEARRVLAEPGRAWRPFNDAQWDDLRRLRPLEDEVTLRARLEAVRAATRSWLGALPVDALAAYADHPQRGVVAVGEQLEGIARHDREHLVTLRERATSASAGASGGWSSGAAR